MKNELRKLIGTLPTSESGFKRRIRFHQGWWRTFVLAEEEGNYPNRKGKRICNTILNGQTSRKNYLSSRIVEAVLQTIEERRSESSGSSTKHRGVNSPVI